MFEFGFFEPDEVQLFSQTLVELPKSWRETVENGNGENVEHENVNNIQVKSKNSIKDENFNDTKDVDVLITGQLNGYYDNSQTKSNDTLTISITKEESQINDEVTLPTNTESTTPDKKTESDSDINSEKVEQTVDVKPKTNKTSWASLFSSTKQELPANSHSIPYTETVKVKDNIKPPRYTDSFRQNDVSSNTISPENDEFLGRIADQLVHNDAVYKSAGLLPRGLTNNSNWCYINATLQALLVCSPFCHLMRSLPSRPFTQNQPIATSTPILDSFVQLIKEFKPLSKGKILPRQKESRYGPSHEPKCIYDMLTQIKSNLSKQNNQEDAEEFLSCVLNGMHEEMLTTTRLFTDDHNMTQQRNDDNAEHETNEDEEDVDNGWDDDEVDEQWEEVTATRKNKSLVTRRTDNSKTAISEIFRGELRSDLHQDGHKGSATLEPFFTLPLDVTNENVKTVAQALEGLTQPEVLTNVTNSKTKLKGDAIRRQTLETLPPVLILHLKRFVYDKKGGSMKVDKEVPYHTDLLIGKTLISKATKKYWQDKRAYKLFAVVYHHGKGLSGGHYTADVYHDRLNCWLNIDDQIVRNTNVHEVVRHDSNKTPYLLYYKRTDLMAV